MGWISVSKGAFGLYLDLSCPLEMISFELLRDDRSNVRAYLSLNNLSLDQIERIEGDIHWISIGKDSRFEAPFIADQLRADAKAQFRLQLSTNAQPDTDQIELIVRLISYVGNTPDWTLDPANLMRIEEPLAPNGAELNRLIGIAGQDARNFPLKTNSYWFCVCGRPNHADNVRCSRCEREQNHVLNSFSRKQVLSESVPVISVEASKVEIPTFLYEQMHEEYPTTQPESERAQLREELETLHQQFKFQRNMLIRRSIFLVVAITIGLGLLWVFQWLSEKQERFLSFEKPLKLESSAMPEEAAPTPESVPVPAMPDLQQT